MILSIEGEVATGKTTMAYTAPRPVVGFNFDLGIKRALYGTRYSELYEGVDILTVPYQDKPDDSLWSDHEITIYELPEPIQLSPDKLTGAKELWNYFIFLFGKAATDPAIRTIVVDTMTLARRIKANAYLQELQESGKDRTRLQQIEWGVPNDSIRSIYTTMESIGKNLVAIHHLRDEYKETQNRRTGDVDSMATGERELDAAKESDRFWDIGIRIEKTPSSKELLVATYVKCGPNLSFEGRPVMGLTWNDLVSQVDGSVGGRLNLERTA